jgi:hypothetical protein
MKHAAILYTCVGLMGTAAVTGFVDYSHASKAGLLKDLYSENKSNPVKDLNTNKEVELSDYSRGPIEEQEVALLGQQDEISLVDPPGKPKRLKKIEVPTVPDAPLPPTPSIEEKEIAPPPPSPAELPTIVQAPVAVPSDTAIEAPAVPAVPEVEAPKEISFKSFSRAPLSIKKSVAKKKKN